MKTRRVLAALVLSGLLLLFSCGENGAETGTTGAEKQETLKIGVMGDDTPASGSAVAGIRYAQEALADPENPVTIVSVSSDKEGAEELIARGVSAVIYTGDPGRLADAADSLAESGIAVLAACRVPEREIPDGGQVFCLYPLSASFGANMAEYLFSGGAKVAVTLTEKGSGYSSDCGDAFVRRFRELAGEEAIPLQEQYPGGQTEFAAVLGGIDYAAADVIFLPADRQTAGRVIAQARQAGISGTFALAERFDSGLSGGPVQTDTTDVLWLSLYNPAEVPDALFSPEDGAEEAILGYDAYALALRACERAQTGGSVGDAVRSGTFAGLTGAFAFDENRVRIIRRLFVVTQRETGPVCLKEITLQK